MAGLKRVYATPLLSHFTARFEPLPAVTPGGVTPGGVTSDAKAGDAGGVAEKMAALAVAKA